MTLVYLQWVDTTVHPDTWVEEEDLKKWLKEDNFTVDEVGWIIEETKEYLLIASSFTRATGSLQYSNVSRIPAPWVKRKVLL